MSVAISVRFQYNIQLSQDFSKTRWSVSVFIAHNRKQFINELRRYDPGLGNKDIDSHRCLFGCNIVLVFTVEPGGKDAVLI